MRASNILCALFIAVLLADVSDKADAVQGTVVFQAGQTLTMSNRTSVYYNATYDTSITTQYIDNWNYQNGETYFWGSTGPDYTYTLGDVNSNPKDKFRTLIRFDMIDKFLPAKAVIQSVQMTVVFINWEKPVRVDACFLKTPWDYLLNGPSYKGTGWRYSRWNGTASEPWKQPGALADCSPDVSISFVVPVNEYYGYVSMTFALDAGKVAEWVSSNGTSNFGLLFRAVNGSLSFITSQWQKDSPALRRPALSISYATGTNAKPPNVTYPVKLGRVSRVWWVDPAGDDELGGGREDSPFRSPAKALFEAWPDDKIYLKTGVYPGDLDVTRPRLTIQSAPGHWAVVSLPMNDPQNAVNVFTLRAGADYGVIQNLEIVGGFYYGIMFFTTWENYGTMEERVASGAGPKHWLVKNVRIHDTGGSGIKLVMKAKNITFSNCEIYNTGARLRTGGHGIEAVQAYDIFIRDSYLHDIPGAAVHLAGGTARAVLERNYVARTNFGFNLGFATDYEYMDPINNPALYESINATARNNIITAVNMAGINVWASRGALIAHNTIWQAQENAQSCILINSYSHDYTPSGSVLTPCADLTIWANLLVRSTTARAGPILQIRIGGLNPSSTFVSDYNIYYDQNGLGPVPFQWGKGAMLEDERTGLTFVGNVTGWAQHCATAMKANKSEINSLEADPRLNPSYAPLSCSPAKSRAAPKLPSNVAAVSDDFSGRKRPTGKFDVGAVQSNAVGASKPLPPVPTAFADKPSYLGVGLGPVYDKNWPYEFWSTRQGKDIYVDAVNGVDQDHNYESNYRKAFKTIGGALRAYNQGDRILLKGGQEHVGPFGVFAPNVTIMTNPADLPGLRATVVCKNTSTEPCIRTGDGLYGGAAALTLSNFDVVMSGSSAGSCIHLNEGAGSGTSAYWAFYLAARGLSPTLSYIKGLTLSGCGLHGIKLSTFVRGVVMEGLTISAPKAAGIEVRGGGDLTIRNCTILNPAETGIRLGGGVRNVLVERNFIKNFGDRGILLGSDQTEVQYMDVDWARSQLPLPDWHDNINTTVRNNILDGGAGAGVAFYSARDAVVVHNTLLRVAATMQAGVLLNVSPKQLGPTQETGAPNTNITFRNNIVTLGSPAVGGSTLAVEARILQGGTVNKQLAVSLPAGTCPTGHHHHRRLLMDGVQGHEGVATTVSAAAATTAAATSDDSYPEDALEETPRAASLSGAGAFTRRELAGSWSYVDSYVNAPGEQGRNPDGSCPMFPADNAWHLDVTSLPVHPNSDAIHANIGGGNLHPDFGGGYTANGQRILYGIPFINVDSSRGTPMTQIDIRPGGYPDESDTSPSGFPFPPNAPVEGAYLNCPNNPCGGDRHVIVVDNATCLLYETYRSFPPGVTGTGKWQADIIARFNLSRNALGRPLGWSSADAAGLPILPGLVKWEEVAVKGVIDHAIRFTGPNSRRAYVFPASHSAPAGYQGPDAPAMGTRVRLRASYDCSPLAPAARVFCTALKKYGGIFADNGSPWYFTGEATDKWDAILEQLYDIAKIPSSAMEVLDSGCLCLDGSCTVVECDGVSTADPNALPVYPAIASPADLTFANNIYFKPGSPDALRYVDRRVPPMGQGYDGGLAGWQTYTGGEAGSVEADPAINAAAGYKPAAGSPAQGTVPRLEAAAADFNGVSRGPLGGMTDAGAVLAA